jgi:S1-C subfamily serine protease
LLFFATVSGIGIRQWANSSSTALNVPLTAPPTSTAPISGGSVPAIAGRVTPALVDVDTVLGYQRAEAAGTGIVLTSDGTVLTNNHVIEEATQIRVTTLANQKVYPASVVGYDRDDDIAVLQLTGASGLTTAAIGDSDKVVTGQTVVGIGNAGGSGGKPTSASGLVTALNQKVSASDESDGTTENLTGLIQTNANIQAGDSGGPLVNTASQVVGVNTAGSTGFSFRSQGHEGFAIPINKALSIAKQIQAKKPSAAVHIGATAFLGVQVSIAGSGGGNSGGGNSGSSGAGAGNTGSPSSGGNNGAPVAGVLPGTPAATVGLAQGDAITAVGGHPVASPTDLSSVLDAYHPGDVVPLTWVDASGQFHTATVTLATGPAA